MKIGEMSPEEFKTLLGEVVEEKLHALLSDPDGGKNLTDNMESRLRASLDSKERMSLETVKNRLGLI